MKHMQFARIIVDQDTGSVEQLAEEMKLTQNQ
jgi:hypothetical protein